MIREFFDSWTLFHNSYLAGMAMAVLLAVTGVMVVARGQVFLGAAISQASTLGIALTLWLSGISAAWHEQLEHHHSITHLAGVVFSVAAALAASRETRPGREGREGITAWLFLLGGALSVLLVANSPHGLEEIHRLQSSSLLGATTGDVMTFALLAASGLALAFLCRQRLILLAVDPQMASAVGMHTRRWSLGLALWTGLVIGFSMYSAGMLFTFGCLVLPAMLARGLCREIAPMFIIAPVLAFAATVAAFILANHYDLPPGQMAIALLSAALPAVWLRRSFSR